MTQGKELQKKASDFFDKVANELSKEMQCREGCSKCCYVQLSIFNWEANLIRTWHAQLDQHEKEILHQKWKKQSEQQEDLHGKMASPCSFLYEEKCTIYSARPLICRTQGLPLLIDQTMSVCPLNFTEALPEKNHWLDLERLNLLSSLIEKNEQQDAPNSRARISIQDLKNELLNSPKKY